MRRALLAALALVYSPAQAQVVSGPATAVDGDTLSLTGVSIRLYGIDAPEAAQTCNRNGEAWQCGRDAAALLSQLAARGPVSCVQRNIDAYERIVATCHVGRLDLAHTLVSGGLAVSLPDFTNAYVAAES